MTSSSKVVTAVFAIFLSAFIILCPAAAETPQMPVNPDVMAARNILDSWGGDGQALMQAHIRVLRALKAAPDDCLALKELARYQMLSGFINNRYVEYHKHVYTVGNFSPGSLEKAEATVRRAIKINPHFAEGYVLLGYLQYQHTNIDEAAKTLSKAEKLGTDDPWLQLNWAYIDTAKGNYSAANTRAERVLASSTTNQKAITTAYQFLIKGYKRTGEYEKVVTIYDRRIKERPNDAWLRGNFAAFLTGTLNRNNEAIAQARAALRIMDYGVGERTLAMALYRKWSDMVVQQKAREGERYFKEAYAIYPDLADVMAYGAAEPAGAHLAKALTTVKHISIDSPAEDGSTALLIATNRNRTKLVRTLLQLHANPNVHSRNGWTPLLSAADEGNTAIVNLLLAKHADVHARAPWNGEDAAFFAKRSGNAELAAKLRKLEGNSN